MNYSIYNQHKINTIIFLNGAGTGQWMWHKQINSLPEYQLITFDYLGHFSSNNSFIDMSTEINRLQQLIKKHHKPKGELYLVGFSLGAQISLLAQQKLNISKVIAISTLNKPNKMLYKIMLPFIKVTIPLVKHKWFAKLNAAQLNINQNMFNDYYNTSRYLSYTSLKNIYRENMSFKIGNVDDSKTKIVIGEKEVKQIKQSAALLSNNYLEIKNAAHDIPYNYHEKLNDLIKQFFN